MSDWKNYQRTILPNIPGLHQIEIAVKNGGYEMLRQVLTSGKWTPESVTNEVRSANIRGRGGAGFNAGLKWSFMPKKAEGVPRYLACNGDESEPNTFKDRRLFEFNPHLFIEGTMIACFAMQMDATYVYMRGEFADQIDRFQRAVDEAYKAGFIGKNILGSGYNCEMYVHKGAGAYICGEETSLMESLEGKRPYPRSKPPFPANYGLWGKPTTINNIETLANVPGVIRNGAKWFTSMGAPTHPGPVLYGLSGHINRPGVYEYPSGMKITDLVYHVGGGMKNGKRLKLVSPGGSSCPLIPAEKIEGLTMDADSLRFVGSVMGTAGLLALDETTDIVKFTLGIAKFYDHESCGQCTPCREGTGWFVKILSRIESGEGSTKDIDLLLDLCDTMEGRTICALADGTAWPIRSALVHFRSEFESKVRAGTFATT